MKKALIALVVLATLAVACAAPAAAPAPAAHCRAGAYRSTSRC